MQSAEYGVRRTASVPNSMRNCNFVHKKKSSEKNRVYSSINIAVVHTLSYFTTRTVHALVHQLRTYTVQHVLLFGETQILTSYANGCSYGPAYI